MKIGSYAPDFELPDTQGNVHHLGHDLKTYRGVVVVFLGRSLLEQADSIETLKQLRETLQAQKVAMVGIHVPETTAAQPSEDWSELQTWVATQKLNFPYLRDVTQEVAHSFGVTRPPITFLVDAQGRVCYCDAASREDSPSRVESPFATLKAFAGLTEAIAQLPNR